ncbi:VOC family protein [Dyella amyloliquefaciens]|uniref:VOC family protein n=1 Tax=Dyella amyloliquefaciens TaxID=1770545 RepID=UPI00102E8FD9|nr:VOC family protein [Dyella amyloliquefaciens]
MKTLSGKLVWVEHASADPAEATRFYSALLGWDVASMDVGGQPYQIIMNAGQGIGGYRQAQPGEHANWGIYLSVPDVDRSFSEALVAGASPCMVPTDFSPAGRGATLLDPTGAMFSIWRSSTDDAPDAPVPPGHWCWHELHATDDEKALRFYESLFGLEHDSMPAGEETYYVLKSGDHARGGLVRNPGGAGPSLWLPYVLVTDVDAAAHKAETLRAEVATAPENIPGIGRYAMLLDPQGALFAVFLPERQ